MKRFCYFDKKVRKATAIVLLLVVHGQGYASETLQNTDNATRQNRVFVSLSYAPAYGGVTDFEIGATGDSSKAVLPYKRDGGAEVLKAANFDWAATDTTISFGNSTNVSMSGSLGIARRNHRIELEVGHELFTAQIPASRATESEPGYYVLPKTMAYDVMNSNTARLGETLSVQSPEDIESFAHVLHAAHPDVDKLMCKNGTKIVVSGGSSNEFPMNGKTFHGGDVLGTDCSGKRRHEKDLLATTASPGLVDAVTNEERGKWPNVSKAVSWGTEGNDMDAWDRDWGRSEEERESLSQEMLSMELRVVREYTKSDRRGGIYSKMLSRLRSAWLAKNPTWWDEKRREAEVDASSQVAGEMTDMNLGNRAIVAGHLAKVVEGGEVFVVFGMNSDATPPIYGVLRRTPPGSVRIEYPRKIRFFDTAARIHSALGAYFVSCLA